MTSILIASTVTFVLHVCLLITFVLMHKRLIEKPNRDAIEKLHAKISELQREQEAACNELHSISKKIAA